MDARFPIFVRSKDCGEFAVFSSIYEIRMDLEEIDVDNEEYEAWDIDGIPLEIFTQKPIGLKIQRLSDKSEKTELHRAVFDFAKSLGMPGESNQVDLTNMAKFIQIKSRSENWYYKLKKKILFWKKDII